MIIDFYTGRRSGADLLADEVREELREIDALDAYEGYVPLADEELSGYQIIYDSE